MAQHNNPMEELSQLLAIAPEDRGESAEKDALHFEARFGEAELVLEDGQVLRVTIDRAFIQLELSGLIIVPGSEHGNICKPNSISVEHTTETVKQGSLKGEGEAGFAGALLGKLSGSASGELSRKHTETTTYQTPKMRVTARGGQKWEIVEPGKEALNGTYLQHDVALCRVRAKRGANQLEATARVLVKQRDMIFAYGEDGIIAKIRLTVNKEKLLNILIAKALHGKGAMGGHLYTGTLVLSEAVTEHEG